MSAGGYESLLAPCVVCGVVFTSNPYRVPSWKDEPICSACIRRINVRRRELGLPLWPVLAGAYEPAGDDEGGRDG